MDTLFQLLHLLALCWMMIGVGATIVPIWQAWRTGELNTRALMLSEAAEAERRWLLPGILAVGISGFAWAASDNINLVRNGWLLASLLIFGLDVFIFLPLLGVGLRRVRIFALQAQKQRGMTEDLRQALEERVPLVFGTLIVLTVPVILWLMVAKPF